MLPEAEAHLETHKMHSSSPLKGDRHCNREEKQQLNNLTVIQCKGVINAVKLSSRELSETKSIRDSWF
jgi:hypothetical protein